MCDNKEFLVKIKSVLLITALFFYGTLMQGQFIKSVGLPIDFPNANEFDPVLSNNGEELAFISDKSGKYKIYISKLVDGKWAEPSGIDAINDFLGGKGNIRYPSFNYNASILYFAADYTKDSSGIDIFYSERINGKWNEPVSLGTPVNSLSYDGQPSISSDDMSLYFTRKNPKPETKDFNCKQVYVSSRKDASQKWGRPKKLPVPINVDCEQAPKIAIDNKTLYFSSVREDEKQGFDIYKTKLIAKNVWIPAERIDTLNTEFDDFTPSLSFNSDNSYYSIIQTHRNGSVSSNIYNAVVPPSFLPGKSVFLKGKINNSDTKDALAAHIIVNDPITSRQIYAFNSDAQTGAYEFFLPIGRNYLLDYQKAKYSSYFYNMDLRKQGKNELVIKNVELFRNITLQLNVFDDELYRLVDANIEVKDKEGSIIDVPIEKIKTGRYKIVLPIGDAYQLKVVAKFFEPYSFNFNLDEIVQFDEFEKDVELSAQKVDFEINVSDEATQAGIPVEVVITNLDNNEVIRTTAVPDSEGKYKIKLRDGDRYNVSVSPKGYSFYNTTVDLKKKKTPRKLEVKLKQLKEDTKLTLNNITFETNSADLNESSYIELNRVVKLMKDNPEIEIEIAAHTDNVGSDVYNLRLSKRRAKSVLLYLLDSEVDANRLKSKGYGESRPLVPNDSDENKALNRRVELKILKVE